MALPDAPDLTVEIAFGSNPGATPVWTDVTEYVLGWSTRRGRQHELDRPDAGEGTLLLHNWDRRFEPENAAGPYSPNVVPMRRVRIAAGWNDLVANGSGETGAVGSQAPSWTFFSGNNLVVANDEVKTGARSLKINNPTAVESASEQNITVVPGRLYEVGGWVKTSALPVADAGWGAVLDVTIITGGGGFTIIDRIGDTPDAAQPDVGLVATGAARDWTFVRTRFTTTTATVIRIDCRLGFGGGQSGTAWFDEVHIWEVYDVFHGFIESFPLIYADGGFDEVVQVKFVDAFKVLALAKIDATYAQQLSGARVNAVLDSAGWPAADRDVGPGISTVPASTLDDVPALTHLIDVATAELGFLYVARDGKVRFIDRHQGFLGVEDYPNHTWGDSGAEYAYSDIVLDFDDSNIWNEVKVTRQGGTEQTASDSASQTKYLRRTLVRSGVLLTTDNEALDQANYLLSRYKEVDLRASSLTLAPQLDTTQWPHVLHHDIGDKVRIRRRPVGGGLIEQEVYIQAISHDWAPPQDAGPGSWQVRWDLSPVGGLQFWILDDPVRSVLDSTTKLGV